MNSIHFQSRSFKMGRMIRKYEKRFDENLKLINIKGFDYPTFFFLIYVS